MPDKDPPLFSHCIACFGCAALVERRGWFGRTRFSCALGHALAVRRVTWVIDPEYWRLANIGNKNDLAIYPVVQHCEQPNSEAALVEARRRAARLRRAQTASVDAGRE